MEETVNDVLCGLVEITFPKDDNFLKVKETLTRIGILNREGNKIYQSCHILQKRGRYFIVHFKELFKLDGKETTLDDEDIARRNTIINLLEEWNLIKKVSTEELSPIATMDKIKIISYAEKEKYELVEKYRIGKKKRI